MQDNNEVQKAPAAPRREWVTPELRSLDLKATLKGSWITGVESVYEEPPHDPYTGRYPSS